MSANKRQVAGDHYNSPIQHWDYVVANDLDYFQFTVVLPLVYALAACNLQE